jgi:hypothetical protein
MKLARRTESLERLRPAGHPGHPGHPGHVGPPWSLPLAGACHRLEDKLA